MTDLLTRPARDATQASVQGTTRRRRPSSLDPREPGAPRRSLVVSLVLTCVTLMTVDHATADGSPLEPLRRLVGEVYGPIQAGADAVVSPFLNGPGWVRSQRSLASDIDRLEAENARMRGELAATDYDRNRLAEYDGLTAAAEQIGYALVPARVIGIGPAQSFTQTVTIDAGTRAGLRPDLTVVNADGLVGRVVRVTSSTATVLLVVDEDSTVGGRIGQSMKVGFLHGRGDVGGLGDDARLDLELVDQATVPQRGDAVVTWGSDRGAPYVSGVPVGRVDSVFSSLRETTQRAVITPYVDFGALDLVGVVVPSGAAGDRAVIEADGSLG